MKLIISKGFEYRGRCVSGIFGFEDDNIVFIRLIDAEALSGKNSSVSVGDVIIGRVDEISEELDAAFVSYAPDKKGFLRLNRLPSKDFKLKCGMLLPVMIQAQEMRGKRAALNAKVDWKRMPDGESLKERSSHLAAFNVLFKAPGVLDETLNELGEVSETVTDSEDVYEKIKDKYQARYYLDEYPLHKLYKLETAMDLGLSRQVWLKSGGYLIIDHTEAMTVIDVNTGGSDHGKSDREKYLMCLNLESSEEIARQLRLRNISGIVIIDFINLSLSNDREALLENMRRVTSSDTSEIHVIDITQLNLMELTRAKKYMSLREQYDALSKK